MHERGKLQHVVCALALPGIFLLAFMAAAQAATAQTASASAHAPVATAWLARHEFQIEIADDFAEREHGLMNRTSMAANHGMLFVFDAPSMLNFWMKNTLIPLDILFFDRDYKLINVQQRVPPCHADPCPTYGSTGSAQYVLELNGGRAEKLGVKPGDKLTVHRATTASGHL